MINPETPKLLQSLLATAIGAGFGAGFAFIFGIVNSRREHKRERQTITRALLTEVHRLNEVIDSHLKWWKRDVDPKTWLPPLVPMATNTYDHLADKIGLIDHDVAEAIVEFYGYVHFINKFQATKEDHEKHQRRQQFYDQYNDVLTRHLERHGNAEFVEYYERYKLPWSAAELRRPRKPRRTAAQ